MRTHITRARGRLIIAMEPQCAGDEAAITGLWAQCAAFLPAAAVPDSFTFNGIEFVYDWDPARTLAEQVAARAALGWLVAHREVERQAPTGAVDPCALDRAERALVALINSTQALEEHYQ